MEFRTRRAGVWLGPAFFAVLALLAFAGGRDTGGRVFYAVFLLAMGYWLLRVLRAGLTLGADGVTVRGQMRTRRFAWAEIRGARVVPMRSMSPLAGRFPYVALQLDLDGDRSHCSEEISAKASERSRIQAIADAINDGVAAATAAS